MDKPEEVLNHEIALINPKFRMSLMCWGGAIFSTATMGHDQSRPRLSWWAGMGQPWGNHGLMHRFAHLVVPQLAKQTSFLGGTHISIAICTNYHTWLSLAIATVVIITIFVMIIIMMYKWLSRLNHLFWLWCTNYLILILSDLIMILIDLITWLTCFVLLNQGMGQDPCRDLGGPHGNPTDLAGFTQVAAAAQLERMSHQVLFQVRWRYGEMGHVMSIPTKKRVVSCQY